MKQPESELDEFFEDNEEVLEVQHAELKPITIGGQTVKAYRMPNGDYRWSMRGASEAVGFGEYWLRDTLRAGGPARVRLVEYGFVGDILKTHGTGVIEPHLISSADFTAIIVYAARAGRPQGWALLIASMQETLERRADYAFGVIRSEEEYRQKFEYRYASILLNKDLRAAIGEWLEEKGEDFVREYCRKHNIHGGKRAVYAYTLGQINKKVFGAYKKEINGLLDLPAYQTPKDSVHVLQLQRMTQLEELGAKYIRKKGVDPVEAIDQAAEVLMIDPEPPKLGDRMTRRDVRRIQAILKSSES